VAYTWYDFYKLPDGTPFKAEYKFNVSQIPKKELFAAIKMAENLDSITLNGKALKPLKQKGEQGKLDEEKSWLDVSFTKVSLKEVLKIGENVLTIEGRKV
jgi:hypothetical protein